MAVGTSSATLQRRLFTCPACGFDVTGSFNVELVLGEVIDGEVKATGKVTGVRVSHDCVPKLTRALSQKEVHEQNGFPGGA